MKKTILIVKNGTTGPEIAERFGDFEVWFQKHVDAAGFRHRILDVRKSYLPGDLDLAGAILMGSPHSVYDELPWLERAFQTARDLVAGAIPTLGVCFGHQVITHARGGTVGRHPEGWEIGTVRVTLTETGLNDPLFKELPREFQVQATHQDAVRTLPKGTRILASNRHDSYQALRHGPTAWSVQFHPEIWADLIRAVIKKRHERLQNDGKNPDALYENVKNTTAGDQVLQNFLAICRQNASSE